MNKFTLQWQIQDFSDRGSSGGSRISQEGALTSKVEVGTYYLDHFFRKLHENEKWRCTFLAPLLDPPMGANPRGGGTNLLLWPFPLKLREIEKKKH